MKFETALEIVDEGGERHRGEGDDLEGSALFLPSPSPSPLLRRGEFQVKRAGFLEVRDGALYNADLIVDFALVAVADEDFQDDVGLFAALRNDGLKLKRPPRRIDVSLDGLGLEA